MQWIKKHKKSRQPSQQPASLGIPSHIGLVPLGINAELAVPEVEADSALHSDESRNRRGADLIAATGTYDGSGSRIVIQDRGRGQQSGLTREGVRSSAN